MAATRALFGAFHLGKVLFWHRVKAAVGVGRIYSIFVARSDASSPAPSISGVQTEFSEIEDFIYCKYYLDCKP